MKIVRKFALATAAGALSLSLVGMVSPAQASYDSGWGCGGWCKSGGGKP